MQPKLVKHNLTKQQKPLLMNNPRVESTPLTQCQQIGNIVGFKDVVFIAFTVVYDCITLYCCCCIQYLVLNSIIGSKKNS